MSLTGTLKMKKKKVIKIVKYRILRITSFSFFFFFQNFAMIIKGTIICLSILIKCRVSSTVG